VNKDLNLKPAMKCIRQCLSTRVEVNKHLVSWGKAVIDHMVVEKIGHPCSDG